MKYYYRIVTVKKKTYSPAKTTKAVKIKAAKKKAGITQLIRFRMEIYFFILSFPFLSILCMSMAYRKLTL